MKTKDTCVVECEQVSESVPLDSESSSPTAMQPRVITGSHFRKNSVQFWLVAGFPSVYMLWSYITCYMNNGSWTYSFMKEVPLLMHPVLLAVLTSMTIAFYEGACRVHVFYHRTSFSYHI